MQKSNTIGELAKALIVFHLKVDSIKKDAKNPFFKSSYASLSNILDSINEPLIESGLALTMFPSGENDLYCLLIHAESGEWIESNYTMKPVKDTPQEKGSCITYQRRYCVSSILNLTIDDTMKDDDGNKATYGNGNPQEPEKEWLNKGSAMFTKAVERLKAGETTMAKIKAAFKVSKEVETLLTNESKN